MLACHLKEAVAQYFVKKRMAVTFELGLCRRGRLRADVLTMSMKGYTIIIEIKSGVPDFKSDSKWPSYMDYCNKLYFAVDELTYKKINKLVPTGVGIFVVGEKLPTKRKYPIRVAKRATHRDIDPDITFNLAVRGFFRGADRNRYKRK